ncbi:hypothetical protein BT69DRAFT_1355819 [Atractiella rhizophila]|nr:hypothetical protein BT69DRAFT_1355819 [Atractiella rhizophila]
MTAGTLIGALAPETTATAMEFPKDASDEDEGYSHHHTPPKDSKGVDTTGTEQDTIRHKPRISFSDTVRITGGVNVPTRKGRSTRRKPIPFPIALPSNAVMHSQSHSQPNSRPTSEPPTPSSRPSSSRRPSTTASGSSGKVMDSLFFSTTGFLPSSAGEGGTSSMPSPTISTHSQSHPPSLKSASKAQSVVSSAVASRSSSPCSSIFAPLSGPRDKPTRPWFGDATEDPRSAFGRPGGRESYHDLIAEQLYRKKKGRRRDDGRGPFRGMLRGYGSVRGAASPSPMRGSQRQNGTGVAEEVPGLSDWDFFKTLLGFVGVICCPCFGAEMDEEQVQEREQLIRKSRSISPNPTRREADSPASSASSLV